MNGKFVQIGSAKIVGFHNIFQKLSLVPDNKMTTIEMRQIDGWPESEDMTELLFSPKVGNQQVVNHRNGDT